MASSPPTQKLLDSRSTSKNTHFLHSMIISSLWRSRCGGCPLVDNSRKAQWVSVRLLHGYLAPRAALKLIVCHHVIKSFSCRIFIYIVSSIFSGHSFICSIHCAPGDRVEHDSTSILSVRGLLSRFRSCASLFNFCQASEAQDWSYFIQCRDALTLTR